MTVIVTVTVAVNVAVRPPYMKTQVQPHTRGGGGTDEPRNIYVCVAASVWVCNVTRHRLVSVRDTTPARYRVQEKQHGGTVVGRAQSLVCAI